MDRASLGAISTSTASRRPRTAVRAFGSSSAMLAVLMTAGCNIPAPFAHNNDFGSPLPANASVEEVVRRVNTNIERVHAWRSNDVRISGQSLPVHLGGQIAVEQPRNFRLIATVMSVDEEADFGSNNDWFWFWVKRGNANGHPSYVYQARHEDVANSQMLSQIPFQPDWLMEALGVVPIDAQHVTLRTEQNGQCVNLISECLSPSGQNVKKVIRVDLRRSVVLSQSLYDINGNLIARARLDKHALDKATGAVMPHLIALEWPQAQLQINLEIEHIDVNPTTIPARNWEVPKKPCYPAFDIGAMSRKRSQMVGASRARGDRVDAASATADASSTAQGPPAQFGAPSPLAGPGRPSASPGNKSGSWPEADGSSEWNQPIQAPPTASTGRGNGPSPFDGESASQPPAASASRGATGDNPFADPPPAVGSQTPNRSTPSSSVAPSRSASSSDNPFESLPR
jgi:hypothetical protein